MVSCPKSDFGPEAVGRRASPARSALASIIPAAIVCAAMSLAWLSPSLCWAAPVAHQSRIVRMDLNHSEASVLTELQATATGVGMHCRAVIHAIHGHHAPPPTRGLQCALSEDPGFFEAFV